MNKRFWMAAALGLLCAAPAGAAEIVFHEIIWPRHDKESGLLVWELRAETARPLLSNREYECEAIELRTFKPVTEEDRVVSQRELFLKSDHGLYVREIDKTDAGLLKRILADFGDNEKVRQQISASESASTLKLTGHVVLEFYGRDTMTSDTDEARLVSLTDDKTGVRKRLLASTAPVRIQSPGHILTGEGLLAEDQVGPQKQDGAAYSRLLLARNVQMTIESQTAVLLPTVPGSSAKPKNGSGGEAAETTVTCAGPFVFDRGENTAVFQNQVVLTRGDTRMLSEKMTLTFKDTGSASGSDHAPPGKMALSHMVAEKNVVVTGKDQQFSGDRFDWDPERTVGRLTGSPARMKAKGMQADADEIEFDQKSNIITYKGRAEVEIDMANQ